MLRGSGDEGLNVSDADRLPSQVTDEYWVWAHARGGRASGIDSGGKWMVFVPIDKLDDWWVKLRDAVQSDRLGPSIKAPTALENPHEQNQRVRVIIVYSADYQDVEDVERVLGELRDMDVYWRLAYKTNEATLAGRYGDGSSLYVAQPGSRQADKRTQERRQGTPP